MRAALAALAMTLATPAMAFDPVTDRSTFESLIVNRDLRMALFGVTLEVRPDGTIGGEAQGWPITGTWSWQDGYFCREMDWGGTAIPYNCQLVEAAGSQVRFTVDRGAGRSATFAIR